MWACQKCVPALPVNWYLITGKRNRLKNIHKSFLRGFCAYICLPECISLLNWTLCYKWYTVIVLWSTLMNTMPMDCYFHTFHMVFHINDNFIIFTDLYTWSGYHSVDCQNTTFNAIGKHTLTVTPYGIRCIWCTYLTCSAFEIEKYNKTYVNHMMERKTRSIDGEKN